MMQGELSNRFNALYEQMAVSNNVSYMRTFGAVLKEMMEWMIQNKPEHAQEWLEKLECIKWKNYLTRKEGQKIVDDMEPRAPWSMEQWILAMQQHGYILEEEPYYNRYAMYVTMSMIASDSNETLKKYVGNGDVFAMIHDLAKDKLKDVDRKFNVRVYFGA